MAAVCGRFNSLWESGAEGSVSGFEYLERVLVYTTVHVLNAYLPILVVSHDEEDGMWQFHWGGPIVLNEVRKVPFSKILEMDRTITRLADLPLGWWARRNSPTEQWERSPSLQKLVAVSRNSA